MRFVAVNIQAVALLTIAIISVHGAPTALLPDAGTRDVIVQHYVEFKTEDWNSGLRVHDTKSKSVNSTSREDGTSTTGIKSVVMGTDPPPPATGCSSTYEPAPTLEQAPVNSLTGSPQLLVQGPGLAFLQSVKAAATEKDRLAVLESQGGGTGFSFDFGNPPPSAIKKNRAGFVISAIGEHFPATLGQGMSTEVTYLAPCGLIPPHLHPRASQTLVVTRGTIKTQFLAGDGMHLQSLTLKELQAGHLPQGAIHYEMNPTCEPAGYVSSFSSDDPGMAFVAPSLLSIDNPAVLGAFGNPDINAAYLDSMRSTIPSGIVETVRLCQRACESLMHAGGGKSQKLRRESTAEQASEQDRDREQVGGDMSVKQMLQQITPNLDLLLQDLTVGELLVDIDSDDVRDQSSEKFELLVDIDSDNVRDQSSEKFVKGIAWKPRHSLLSVRDGSHQEKSSTAPHVADTADETNETDENPYLAYDVNDMSLDDHEQDYSGNEEDNGDGVSDEYAWDDYTKSIPGVSDFAADDSSGKDLPDYSGDVDFEPPLGSDIVPIEDVDYDFQEYSDDLNLLDGATPLYSASRWPNWKLIKDHVFGPVRVEDKERDIVSYNVPHKPPNYKTALTGPVSSVIPSKPQSIPPADSVNLQSTASEPKYINTTAVLVHSDYPQIPSKVQFPGIFPRPPVVETSNPHTLPLIPADDEDDDDDYDEGEEEEEEDEDEEANGFFSILRTPRHEHSAEDETVDIYSQSDDTEGDPRLDRRFLDRLEEKLSEQIDILKNDEVDGEEEEIDDGKQTKEKVPASPPDSVIFYRPLPGERKPVNSRAMLTYDPMDYKGRSVEEGYIGIPYKNHLGPGLKHVDPVGRTDHRVDPEWIDSLDHPAGGGYSSRHVYPIGKIPVSPIDSVESIERTPRQNSRPPLAPMGRIVEVPPPYISSRKGIPGVSQRELPQLKDMREADGRGMPRYRYVGSPNIGHSRHEVGPIDADHYRFEAPPSIGRPATTFDIPPGYREGRVYSPHLVNDFPMKYSPSNDELKLGDSDAQLEFELADEEEGPIVGSDVDIERRYVGEPGELPSTPIFTEVQNVGRTRQKPFNLYKSAI